MQIAVDLAIKVVTKRLRQDATLLQRTSLPVEDIIDLLSFCVYQCWSDSQGTGTGC
jgi:hypothetical protein